ncbi:helix-turn-helix domain-containing protein [Streptosporangium saharense]|uniref:helix-turn-helix domain-containing protein n=1 Tax=Streptosporangium saharense TaxID=1706840 RepID=UPI003414BA05
MQRISPPRRQLHLAQILRDLRRQRGWTLDDAVLGLRSTRRPWSRAKLSRIETAEALPAYGDVADLLDAYEADEQIRQMCSQLVRQARSTPWWQPFGDVLGEYVALETEAVKLRSWQPFLIPGLFQTPEYARAVFTAGLSGQAEPKIEHRVRARIARQRLLDCDNPIRFDVVVGEQALRRPVCGRQAMAEQLARLMFMLTWPHVTVRVLEDRVGTHPGFSGPFVLLSLPRDERHVFFETPPNEIITNEVGMVHDYERRFDGLAAKALTPEKSVDFIHRTARELGC